jgi:hypothetical protein
MPALLILLAVSLRFFEKAKKTKTSIVLQRQLKVTQKEHIS